MNDVVKWATVGIGDRFERPIGGIAERDQIGAEVRVGEPQDALRLFLIYDISEADRKAGLDELTRLLVEGRLVHWVARRLPLDQIADAHDIVERGEIIGNVVLNIP